MTAVFDNGPSEPCPAPFNMAAYVLGRAAKVPDKLALSILGEIDQNWTYSALAAAVTGCAAGLLQQGLKPGDRVLLRLGNTVDFPIAYLAAIAVGLIPIPTSAMLTTPEITAIAAEAKPALIVAGADIALPDPQPCPVMTADELAACRSLPPAAFQMGDPNRPAYIIYTSGTSGRARGVVHAHRAIWARRMMWQGWYGLKPDDRLLHAGAFNWTYTLGTGLMDPWAIGATALIPAAGTNHADLAALMARHRATIFAAAPGVYRHILRADMPSLPALRHGLSAGEKLPATTRDQWQAATGTEIYEAFGMSECSTFISGAPGDPAAEGTLGRPQPGRRVAILHDGAPVDFDTPGELAISANDPGLMLCYLDAALPLTGDWFCTGDMARMHPSGAITYLGRSDDMMNAGGYRVSPVEVEQAMRQIPGLEDCAAAEVNVAPEVTVIALFYTGANLPELALSSHAELHLARYKQPRLFVRMDALPRGANNKILRKSLRQYCP